MAKKNLWNNPLLQRGLVVAICLVVVGWGGYYLFEKMEFQWKKNRILKKRKDKKQQDLEVLANFKNQSPQQVAKSLYSLAAQSNEKALEVARELSADKNPILVRAAVHVLGKLGGEQDIAQLQKQFVANQLEEVREDLFRALLASVQGLEFLTSEQGRQALSEKEKVRVLARVSRQASMDLKKRKEARKQLNPYLMDSKHPMHMITLLEISKGEPRNGELVKILEEKLKLQSPVGMEWAAQHLAQVGSDWFKKESLNLLKTGNKKRQVAVLRAIGKACPKKATPSIIKIYQDSRDVDVKLAAISALQYFKSQPVDDLFAAIKKEPLLTHEARKSLLRASERQVPKSKLCL
jgi:HEAT repeat protein